jgi:hypothetical protein
VRFLPVVFIPAEVDTGAAFCFSAAEAGTLEIVRAVLDVRAEFLLQLRVAIKTPEESGQAEAEGTEDGHTSSGCVERAAVMAMTSRFQLSVSSCRLRWPPAVSV